MLLCDEIEKILLDYLIACERYAKNCTCKNYFITSNLDADQFVPISPLLDALMRAFNSGFFFFLFNFICLFNVFYK